MLWTLWCFSDAPLPLLSLRPIFAMSHLIARDAAQGEIIRRVILHELTHKAEGSRLYGKLSKMILDMKYGGDQAQIDAAITNDGVSKFAEDTVQRAERVPVDVKQEFATNPLLRTNAKDTN